MSTVATTSTDNIRSIVRNKTILRQPSAPVTEDDNIEELGDILLANLTSHEGIGLSAPQIGIMKQMCVVNVQEPVILINPRIVDRDGMTPYVEGCLSFPGKVVKTTRAVRVEVEADNYDAPLVFGPDTDDFELDDIDLMESVAIQHEIDHLNGVLMFDRELKAKPVRVENRIGRNEKVVLKAPDSDERMTIKYKKAEKYLNEGWTLVKNSADTEKG